MIDSNLYTYTSYIVYFCKYTKIFQRRVHTLVIVKRLINSRLMTPNERPTLPMTQHIRIEKKNSADTENSKVRA